ncbi:MAG: peptidoglycan-binding protein [Clostridia bacterium]|nr:peptidoglycan-binding protein [Clostridia bacterium]MBQ9401529.1 peptidoglycan-binding protein [Clostridia bacterium]
MIQPSDLIEKFKYALNDHWGYIWGQWGGTWTQAKQNAASREMTIKYGSKWIGHRVADCSGLFRWAYSELGEKIAHGSNSIFDRYCSAKGQLKKGKRTDGADLLPGTAVFTGDSKEHGHIGLFIGNGEVIEAAGTEQGVIKSKVTATKWTWWGELKALSYPGRETSETPSEPTAERPTLRRGSKGEFVTMLQTELIRLGYALPKYGADGDFGNETLAALKAFQQDNGLNDDGVCGPKTWEKLEDAKPMQLYTVTIPHLPKHEAEALVKNYKESKMMEE